jgi:hypothetical protein
MLLRDVDVVAMVSLIRCYVVAYVNSINVVCFVTLLLLLTVISVVMWLTVSYCTAQFYFD